MPKTLLLDRTAWDLVLDSSGNIALADEPYAIAQDVASAVRTFTGECWYDTSKGIPHWQLELGQYPPLQYVRDQVVKTALTEPNVADAKAVFVSLSGRQLTGQLQIIDTAGKASGVSF